MAGLVATLVAAAVLTARSARPFGHPSPGKAYPERENFTLWLVEEFGEPIDLDADPVWTWSDGALPGGAVRFVKDGVKFENGRLVLEAKTAEPGSPTQSCSHAEAAWIDDKPMVSGEMRARHNMFRYGYYEAKMRTLGLRRHNTTASGGSVSSFSVFRDARFKQWRDINIELSDEPYASVTARVLHANSVAHPGLEAEAHMSCSAGDRNLEDEFHTYAFEWLPTSITWYLDGVPIAHHASNEEPPIPELPGKVMMNLWVLDGGTGSGDVAAASGLRPLRSEYEWFRYYRWNGEHTYPCAAFSDGCLTEEDLLFGSNNPCDGLAHGAGCTAACHLAAGGSPISASATGGVGLQQTSMQNKSTAGASRQAVAFPGAASWDAAFFATTAHVEDDGAPAAPAMAAASTGMMATAPAVASTRVVKGFLRGAVGDKPIFP